MPANGRWDLIRRLKVNILLYLYITFPHTQVSSSEIPSSYSSKLRWICNKKGSVGHQSSADDITTSNVAHILHYRVSTVIVYLFRRGANQDLALQHFTKSQSHFLNRVWSATSPILLQRPSETNAVCFRSRGLGWVELSWRITPRDRPH